MQIFSRESTFSPRVTNQDDNLLAINYQFQFHRTKSSVYMWRLIHQVKSGYYMIREVIQNVRKLYW